jgi:hypothetical protein
LKASFLLLTGDLPGLRYVALGIFILLTIRGDYSATWQTERSSSVFESCEKMYREAQVMAESPIAGD